MLNTKDTTHRVLREGHEGKPHEIKASFPPLCTSCLGFSRHIVPIPFRDNQESRNYFEGGTYDHRRRTT